MGDRLYEDVVLNREHEEKHQEAKVGDLWSFINKARKIKPVKDCADSVVIVPSNSLASEALWGFTVLVSTTNESTRWSLNSPFYSQFAAALATLRGVYNNDKSWTEDHAAGFGDLLIVSSCQNEETISFFCSCGMNRLIFSPDWNLITMQRTLFIQKIGCLGGKEDRRRCCSHWKGTAGWRQLRYQVYSSFPYSKQFSFRVLNSLNHSIIARNMFNSFQRSAGDSSRCSRRRGCSAHCEGSHLRRGQCPHEVRCFWFEKSIIWLSNSSQLLQSNLPSETHL